MPAVNCANAAVVVNKRERASPTILPRLKWALASLSVRIGFMAVIDFLRTGDE
jgi:hypothetical protein